MSHGCVYIAGDSEGYEIPEYILNTALPNDDEADDGDIMDTAAGPSVGEARVAAVQGKSIMAPAAASADVSTAIRKLSKRMLARRSLAKV